MTRTLRAVAVLCSFSCLSAAQADGDPKSFAEPVAQFTWTGFYVGAQLGGLANLTDIDDPLGPSLFGNPNVATGPFAGLQGGYNYQSGMIVYGLEADVAFAQTEGTSTCSSLSGSFINSNCVVGVDAFGSITGRIGLALGPEGRSLVYGKAGAAWSTGSVKLATGDSTNGAGGNPFGYGKDDFSQWGWTIGAGAEHALSGRWSVKAEYDYAGFGDQSARLLPSAFLSDAGAVTSSVPAREGSISTDLHTFKLGLNYRFGASVADLDAQPVSAVAALPAANPYGFEFGGRYWYSWGRHKYDLGVNKLEPIASYALISRLTYDDINASTGEGFGRVTTPWNVFAKGFIGGGTITGGQMNDEDFNIPGDTPGTTVPYTNTLSPEVKGDIPWYGTVDVGYNVWQRPGQQFGGFVGYNYYQETMGAYGCAQTANPIGPCGPASSGFVATSGHAIISQEAKWQSLRLGVATEFEILPGLRLSGEAAYLPYVSLKATDHHFRGNTPAVASVNVFSGNGIGTQLEAMLSYDITPQLSLGVGARYWAMWTTDASEQRVYSDESPGPFGVQHTKLETERAGVLTEIRYKLD